MKLWRMTIDFIANCMVFWSSYARLKLYECCSKKGAFLLPGEKIPNLLLPKQLWEQWLKNSLVILETYIEDF